MDIIVAGWGRTGTRSLKFALEQLLGKPCYHMQNILLNKKEAKKWHDFFITNKKNVNWDEIYKGYGATLDFPGCNYYKELMKKYPNAKVILTQRDSESWIKSWNVLENKILKSFSFRFAAKIPYTSFSLHRDIHNHLILGDKGAFKGKTKDSDRMKLFEDWNQSVINYVPKDRLLIYHPKEGWEPICKFLNKPVPTIEYPHLNKTKNMGHMSRFINSMFILIVLLIISGMMIAWYFFDITYFQ